MTALIKYDAACKMIAAAKRVDEVKNIRDRAEAMRAYSRQAKNKDLEADALEIRMRATRRMDQLREDQKRTIGLATGGDAARTRVRKQPESKKPTLASQGIDKNLANEMRGLGKLSEPQFEKAVAVARAGITKAVQSAMRQDNKKEKRAAREAELAVRITALPAKRYGVIVADPEWRFEPWSRETGMDRAADNHYPTSVTEAIAARDVASIAAKDCVLFLWATAPMMPQALLVMSAWGFDYRSHVIWKKDRIGNGYWFRNCHELLLIGVRGKVPAPAPGTQFASVINGPATEHSAKPEIFLEIVEQYFPNVPKIELNRRGAPRSGWDAWGAEVLEAAE